MKKKETKAKKPTTKKTTKTAPVQTKTASKTTTKTATKQSASKALTKTTTKKPAAKTKQTSTKATPAKKTTAAKQPSQTEQNGLVTVEIRRHRDANGGHPHIMVDILDDKNISVGITHDSKKGKKHNNIPLEHNPLGGSEQTYMHKQGTVDKKANYSVTKKTGQLTAADNDKAKAIGNKAKQKHLSTQKPKK